MIPFPFQMASNGLEDDMVYLTHDNLSTEVVVSKVQHNTAGAISLFIGQSLWNLM